MTDEKKPVKKASTKKPAAKKTTAKAKTATKTTAKKTVKKATTKKAAPKKKPVTKAKVAKKAPATAKKKAPAKKAATKPAAKKKAAPPKTTTKAKTAKTETAAAKKKAAPKKTASKTTAKPKTTKKATTTAKKKAAPKKTASKAKATKAETGATKKKAPAKKAVSKTTAKKTATKTSKEETSVKKKAPAKKKPAAKKKASPKKESTTKEAAASTTEEAAKTTSAQTDDSATDNKTKPSTRGSSRRKQPQTKSKSSDSPKKSAPAITYKLLVNADEPEECRIALLENGKVESFSVETVVRAQTKGNIYKGIITAVEPNLQAAFVDMGTGKNGFLPFSDIHPEYYCKDVGKRTHWKDLSIQSVVMKGQEVLVEVVKETTGNKGANLTTYLSMPGRYVVLMPGSDSHGISRKISNEERRKKLREIVKSANLPEEIGYIIRTASEDITKTALMQDIRYQLDLWTEIKQNGQTMRAPAIVYKEQNVVARFLRDHYTPEIDEIMVDNKDVFDKVNQFMEMLPAKQRTTKVKLHRGSKPIFNQFQVEEQIEQMYQPQVPLPSGGSIVIDPTEALVAIDVNSGRTSKDKNFEKTIFLANMEAADELARQLRLRDLGGLIVVDFIDMRDKRNIREVEKTVRDSLKKDKAKIDTSRISKFGLMQISRQRLGPPIQKGNYIKCEHCQGSGIIKSVETTSLALLRRIQTGAAKRHITAIECELPIAIAQYLLNQKRADIVAMEKKYRVEIRVISNPAMTPAQEEIRFVKKDT